MNTTSTIRFYWNKENKKGELSLFLKMSVINNYAMAEYLDSYNSDIGLVSYPVDGITTFQALKDEITEFESIIEDYKLLDKTESQFHRSHLLFIIQTFIGIQKQLWNQQKINIKLSNRVELLKELQGLTRDSNCDYEITISKKLPNDFKYTFHGESKLKKQVLRYLVGEVKSHLKTAYQEVWDTEFEDSKELSAETLQILSNYELTQKALAQVAMTILRYLNNETIALKNRKQINNLSLTNSQGEFIYEIFTVLGVYSPQKRTSNDSIKRTHHDAIRKLIQRYSDKNEDN